MSVWHDALEIGLLPLEETGLYCDGMTYVISERRHSPPVLHRLCERQETWRPGSAALLGKTGGR